METLSSQEKAMETVKCCAEKEAAAEREIADATADATAAESDAEVHAPPQLRQMSQCQHPPTVQTEAATKVMHAYQCSCYHQRSH